MWIVTKILDFIFPPLCPVCNERVGRHGEVCTTCIHSVLRLKGENICEECGYPFFNFFKRIPKCPHCISNGKKHKVYKLRSACAYDDFSKKIILPFKHAKRVKVANFMAAYMAEFIEDFENVDAVIPVPLSFWRQFMRGYNQASLLGKPLAKTMNVPFYGDVFKRKHSESQGNKSAAARMKNVAKVFRVVKPELITGKHILIVDDVVTSGSTVSTMARVLVRSGASKVSAISFARVLKVS